MCTHAFVMVIAIVTQSVCYHAFDQFHCMSAPARATCGQSLEKIFFEDLAPSNSMRTSLKSIRFGLWMSLRPFANRA